VRRTKIRCANSQGRKLRYTRNHLQEIFLVYGPTYVVKACKSEGNFSLSTLLILWIRVESGENRLVVS